MTVEDFLRVLREQWLVAVAAVALGLAGAGAGAAFAFRPAEYTAQLTMYVSSQGTLTQQAPPSRAPSQPREPLMTRRWPSGLTEGLAPPDNPQLEASVGASTMVSADFHATGSACAEIRVR